MEILLSEMQSFVSQRVSGASVNVLQPLQPGHLLDGNSISSSTSYLSGTLVNINSGLGISEEPAFEMDSIATASANLNQADERLGFFRS